jgi:hypothetical protein
MQVDEVIVGTVCDRESGLRPPRAVYGRETRDLREMIGALLEYSVDPGIL